MSSASWTGQTGRGSRIAGRIDCPEKTCLMGKAFACGVGAPGEADAHFSLKKVFEMGASVG